MKTKQILNVVVIVLLVVTSGYSLIKIANYNEEINNIRKEKKELVKKIEEQENFQKEIEENLKVLNDELIKKGKELEESNNKIIELEKEKTLLEEKVNYESTPTEKDVIGDVSYSNSENYASDPVAERDAFAESFEVEHGRPPSSGEIQMDWLQKQGLVE